MSPFFVVQSDKPGKVRICLEYESEYRVRLTGTHKDV